MWEQCAGEESGYYDEAEEREPELYVSINRLGDIAMSAEAFDRLGETWNVALLYDRERQRIGVKFPIMGDKRFFALRPYGRGGRGRVVRAARLMKEFGIVVERTMRFRGVEVVGGKVPMLVLDLKTAEPIA
jgi:hypothetical protein